MQKISKEEMQKISGGSVDVITISILISGLLSFIAGIRNGYVNPQKCNN